MQGEEWGKQKVAVINVEYVPIWTSTRRGSLHEALTSPIGIESDVADMKKVGLEEVGVGELAVESIDLRPIATLTTRDDEWHDEAAYHEEEHGHSRSVHPIGSRGRHCEEFLEDGGRRADDCKPGRKRERISGCWRDEGKTGGVKRFEEVGEETEMYVEVKEVKEGKERKEERRR